MLRLVNKLNKKLGTIDLEKYYNLPIFKLLQTSPEVIAAIEIYSSGELLDFYYVEIPEAHKMSAIKLRQARAEAELNEDSEKRLARKRFFRYWDISNEKMQNEIKFLAYSIKNYFNTDTKLMWKGYEI